MSALKNWNGEFLISHYHKDTGSFIFIALHSTRLGAATGGTRMMEYHSADLATRDALRLAQSMSYKFAMADFPRGGGKAVIWKRRSLGEAQRNSLLKDYGKLINQLGGIFQTGPDLGTSYDDMEVLRSVAPNHVFCKDQKENGAGDSASYTARGIHAAIHETCHYLNIPNTERIRVWVEGAGSVGYQLSKLLLESGAEVFISEIDQQRQQIVMNELPVKVVRPDAMKGREIDVFAPCALGGTLTRQFINDLNCRAIVGAANNQLQSGPAEKWLTKKGILYAPDFIVNSAGAVCVTGIEALNWDESRVTQQLSHMCGVLINVYEQARSTKRSTHEVAITMANQKLGLNRNGSI